MDTRYMKQAIELAKKGKGATNPNPLVGAVIVKNNKVIAEGYHEYYGGPHAEINALKNAVEDVEGATMYVTLEPCSHYGKTNPCTDAIIKNKLGKVVVGMIDPNPLVAGKGIQKLRKHGIEVIVHVLEDEIRKLNEVFLKYITMNLPYCILKTAMTLDGKIATANGDSKWISNEASRYYVHQLRNTVMAIMVGIGTVLADDPMLTTRLKNEEGKDPIRVIIDSSGKIPLDAKVINPSSKARTILATTSKMSKEKQNKLIEKGVQVLETPIKNDQVDLQFLMKELGLLGIDSVLIEGGSTLGFSLLEEGLIDKVLTFIAPKIIGGVHSISSIGGKGVQQMKDAFVLENIEIRQFEEDLLIEGHVRKEVKNVHRIN